MTRAALGAALVALLAAVGPADAQTGKGKKKAVKDAEAAPANDKVVEFCKKQVGEQVGNGECWTLANSALRAAGAKSSPAYKDAPNKGDYVWGELVYGVEVADGKPKQDGAAKRVRPGDVVQFRDAKFKGRRPGGGTYTMSFGHHTAVVSGVSADGVVLTLLHQNYGGKKTVGEVVLVVTDLQSGWIKVYRPQV